MGPLAVGSSSRSAAWREPATISRSRDASPSCRFSRHRLWGSLTISKTHRCGAPSASMPSPWTPAPDRTRGSPAQGAQRKTRSALCDCSQRALGKGAGDNLLSHRVAPAVPSAPEGLTSVFGMGTGGTPRLSSPAKVMYPHPCLATEWDAGRRYSH